MVPSRTFNIHGMFTSLKGSLRNQNPLYSMAFLKGKKPSMTFIFDSVQRTFYRNSQDYFNTAKGIL